MKKSFALKRFFGVAAIGAASMAIMFGAPRQAQAVACPCAPVCAICVQCVQASVSSHQSMASGLFSTLTSSNTALDQAIEVGVEAENNAIDYSGGNIVGAQQAHAASVATTIAQGSAMEQQLLQAIQNSLENLTKSALLAKANYRVSSEYGSQNVSRASTVSRNLQSGESPRPSEVDDPERFTSHGDDPLRVTADFMIDVVQQRSNRFLEQMLTAEHGRAQELEMEGLFHVFSDGGLHDTVLLEEGWHHGVVMRRTLAIPRGVQAGMREVDLRDGDDRAGYWRIVLRSRSVASFLAWEMALRSEIETDEGSTSLLNYLKEATSDAYANSEAMLADGSSGKRKLLNTIAANEALGNLIDMLLLEAESYGNTIEGAKMGLHTDEVFNPYYGYNTILSQTTGTGATRGE